MKTFQTFKQGEYSDREIIMMMNKIIKKIVRPVDQPKLTMFMISTMGYKIQGLLKERNMLENEVQEIIADTYANPPTPPPVEPTPEPVKESNEAKLARENVSTSRIDEKGKEHILFSEQGMKNLHSEDNDLFESVGKDRMNDHEDDGRIFKTRIVKRLSDEKQFTYDFVWHPEWDCDFWNNEIVEV
jgi:hypothetical protein